MLKSYLPLPAGAKRVVEPYLGSGGYSLNQEIPFLGVDADPQVTDLWYWLQREGARQDLIELAARYAEIRDAGDLRKVSGLSEGARLYLKINVCSLVVGQWSSWRIYPQNQLPVWETLRALSQARRGEVHLGRALDVLPRLREGDVLFVDPPYVGTSANYQKEREYDPQETLDLLAGVGSRYPVLFTYGDGAPEVFPGLPWETCLEREVPNFRNGGTVPRTEYACYLNWPPEGDILTLFG